MSQSEYVPSRADSVRKMFQAFRDRPNEERVLYFASRLAEFSEGEVADTCNWLVDHAEHLPPFSRLLEVLQGQTERAGMEGERTAQMRYHLERYSDCDYWLFRTTYGEEPTLELFDRLGVEPPPDVTFEAPSPEACRQMRQEAMAAARAAMPDFARESAMGTPREARGSREKRERVSDWDWDEMRRDRRPEADNR